MRINVEVAVDSKGVATFKQLGEGAKGAGEQAGKAGEKIAKLNTFVGQLQANVERVQRSLSRPLGAGFFDDIGKNLTEDVGGKVLGSIAGAAALAGAAVAGAAYSMLQLSDQMSNLSGRTGVGVEALQKFQFAGAAVGVSVEEIASGMQRFQRGLVEGSDATLAALGKLGLGREALANMLPEDQLQTVLSALNEKIPNAANRTQIAMELLGRGGAALLPLGDGLEDVMKRAEELGLVMSSSDVQAADALGDSIGALQATFGGLLNTVGSVITSNQSLHTLVAGLQTIVAGFTADVRNNRTALQDLVSGGVELVTSGLLLMIDAVGLAGTAWAALKLTWLSALNVGGALAEMQLKLRLAAAQSTADTLTGKAPLHGSANDPAYDPALWAAKKAAADAAVKDLEQQIAMVGKWKDANAEAAGKTVESNSRWTDSIAKIHSAMSKLAGSVAAAHGKQVEFSGSTSKSTVTLEANKKALEEAAKASDLWWKGQEDVEAAIQKADATLRTQFGPSVQDATIKMYQLTQNLALLGKQGPVSAAQLQSFVDQMRPLIQAGGQAPEAIAAYMKALEQLGHVNDSNLGGMSDVSAELAEQANASEEARIAAEQYVGTLRGLADLSGALGFEGLATTFEDSANWAEQFDEACKDGVLDVGELLSLAAGLVNAFKHATDSASGMSRALNTAILGANVGKKIGSLFGPVGAAWGAVIGGFIGGVVGLFKKPGWVKAGEAAGKVLGFGVSKELAKAIEKTAKDLHIDFKNATLLNLPAAITESGKAASTFAPQMQDLIKAIASGAVPAKEGMEALEESFSMLAEEASKAKFASLEMFAVMKQARDSGVMTEGMKAAITAAIESMGQALGKTGGLAIASEQAAINSATIFGLVWSQTVAEKGLIGAADALGPAFEALQKKLEESGFGEAAAAIFGPIASQFALANDEMFRGAAEAAQGYSDILKSAINTAMPVTIEQFNAFGSTAVDAFNQAEAAALALGLSTEESQTQALLAVAPLLQQLQQAAAAYGFTLDAGTQALLDQAKAAGVAFPTQPVDRMASAMERLVEIFEKVYGFARGTADAMGEIGGTSSNLGQPGGGGGSGDIGGYLPSHGGGIGGASYASGGIAHGSSLGYGATLHGTEAVMTLPQLYGEMAGVVSNTTAHMLAGMIKPSPTSTTASGTSIVSGAQGGGDNAALIRELIAEQRATRRAIESAQPLQINLDGQRFAEARRTNERRNGR